MSERLETLTGLLDEVRRAAESWDPEAKGSSEGLAWALDDLKDALPPGREDLAALVQQARDTLEGAEELGEEERKKVRETLSLLVETMGQLLAGDGGEADAAGGGEETGEGNDGNAGEPEEEEEEEIPFVLLPEEPDVELIGEMVTESKELLENAEAALLTLETDPEDEEAINTVFRAFHTLKGTSAFLGLEAISELAHRAETLLSRVRDKEIRYGGPYADLALRSVDLLKELLDLVVAGAAGERVDRPENYDLLMRQLADPDRYAAEAGEEEPPLPHARVGDILASEGKVPDEVIQQVEKEKGEKPLGEALVKAGAARVTDVADALRKQKRLDRVRRSVDASVRVRTDRLDRLIEMVGELVIAHSMVAQDQVVTDGAHYDLIRKITHMGKIVRELQDLSMSMRMVPLRATFQKMNRLVRDVAQKVKKKVVLVTEGEDTEIDRNMVDAIGDPLVHMIRNAVDHGLETEEERLAAGKPPVGTVRLSACHSGGSVVVAIEDDGRGLDRDKIVQKAIERGVIDSDKGLSDSDVFQLIFEPGFSTADKVTDVSGRGVGLDVVKKNIEALHGRVDIESERGKGTVFRIYLPLTLAITDGMLIRCGSERYILPTANIVITFQPRQKDLSTVAGHGEMVMFRDRLIPMFRLGRLFGIPDAVEEPTKGLLVIVRGGDRDYALLVDELLGQQQIVAKSLGQGIGKVPGVSGAAILGDGRVGLILDPQGLGALARRGSGAFDMMAV